MSALSGLLLLDYGATKMKRLLFWTSILSLIFIAHGPLRAWFPEIFTDKGTPAVSSVIAIVTLVYALLRTAFEFHTIKHIRTNSHPLALVFYHQLFLHGMMFYQVELLNILVSSLFAGYFCYAQYKRLN